MMRPVTIVCGALFLGSCWFLFATKERARLMDREQGRIWRATDAATDRIALLRAEWAVLNEPERLRELAQRHLGLAPIGPDQIASSTDLPRRLPVVAPHPLPEVEVAQAIPPGALPGAPRAVSPPVAQPPRTAEPVRPVPNPPPRPVAVVQATAPMPQPAPRPPAAPRGIVAEALSPPAIERAPPVAAPTRPPVARAAAEPVLRPAPRAESVQPAVASALGTARSTLPPPIPYAADTR